MGRKEYSDHVASRFTKGEVYLGRRRLPAACLPIGRLNVLEVFHGLGVVEMNLFLKYYQRVADKQMGQVVRKVFIYTSLVYTKTT